MNGFDAHKNPQHQLATIGGQRAAKTVKIEQFDPPVIGERTGGFWEKLRSGKSDQMPRDKVPRDKVPLDHGFRQLPENWNIPMAPETANRRASCHNGSAIPVGARPTAVTTTEPLVADPCYFPTGSGEVGDDANRFTANRGLEGR